MYIVTGSITSALRLSKVMEKNFGQIATVVHTPQSVKKGGCSYSVKTDFDDIKAIKKIAYDAQINIKGIYGEKNEGGGREFYDIS